MVSLLECIPNRILQSDLGRKIGLVEIPLTSAQQSAITRIHQLEMANVQQF